MLNVLSEYVIVRYMRVQQVVECVESASFPVSCLVVGLGKNHTVDYLFNLNVYELYSPSTRRRKNHELFYLPFNIRKYRIFWRNWQTFQKDKGYTFYKKNTYELTNFNVDTFSNHLYSQEN